MKSTSGTYTCPLAFATAGFRLFPLPVSSHPMPVHVSTFGTRRTITNPQISRFWKLDLKSRQVKSDLASPAAPSKIFYCHRYAWVCWMSRQRHSAVSSIFGRLKLPKPLKSGRGAAPHLELVLLLSTAALLMSLAIRAARVVNRVQECRCGAAVLVKAALDGEIRSSGGRSEGRVPVMRGAIRGH